MASIIKKKIKNQVYYYLVESKRVNGKPRYTNQVYLGKAEDIAEKLKSVEEQQKPKKVAVFSFGPETALLSMAKRLQLVETIDRHAAKRAQGLSVGEYMLLAAINRAVAPTSKNKFSEWYEKTVLKRIFRFKTDQLSSKRFWDNMTLLTESDIQAIEAELVERMVKEFDIDLECLLYDATNFSTFIDTKTDAKLPQRGHAKDKRNDLRIIGLALLVSKDFHIPLLHHTYPGNVTDSAEFGTMTARLTQRLRLISEGVEQITLVFDKGNNSEANLTELDQASFGVVSSLVPSQHKDLLSIPYHQFIDLSEERYPGVTVCRATKRVFGETRTILVVFNKKLFDGQMQGLNKAISRCSSNLAELKERLDAWSSGARRKGTKPTKESTQRKVAKFLSAKHLKDLFEVEVSEEGQFATIQYAFRTAAFEELQETLLGKTILFTNNNEWSNEEIVSAYRGQAKIEEAFKRMKDPHFLSFSPMFHWTDQKIMVHTFYCVLSLMLCSLLRQELHRSGINVSIPCMLEKLSFVQEVLTIHGESRKGKKKREYLMLTEMDSEQQAIYDSLGLEQYTV
jgi:transposase